MVYIILIMFIIQEFNTGILIYECVNQVIFKLLYKLIWHHSSGGFKGYSWFHCKYCSIMSVKSSLELMLLFIYDRLKIKLFVFVFVQLWGQTWHILIEILYRPRILFFLRKYSATILKYSYKPWLPWINP